jgi:hypothetical protein
MSETTPEYHGDAVQDDEATEEAVEESDVEHG